jgi:hypothetical protein
MIDDFPTELSPTNTILIPGKFYYVEKLSVTQFKESDI